VNRVERTLLAATLSCATHHHSGYCLNLKCHAIGVSSHVPRYQAASHRDIRPDSRRQAATFEAGVPQSRHRHRGRGSLLCHRRFGRSRRYSPGGWERSARGRSLYVFLLPRQAGRLSRKAQPAATSGTRPRPTCEAGRRSGQAQGTREGRSENRRRRYPSEEAARADNTPWHQWLVQEAYSAIDRALALMPRMGRTGDSPEEVGAFLSAG
jgi:hypothetical protein